MSNEIFFDESTLNTLKGKNVVFTGGASGIGKEAVTIFARAGANIVFGDVDKVNGDKLAAELGSNVKCHKVDVSKWDDLKSLFAVATEAFGPPDIVCANAGIHEHEDWLSEAFLEKECKWPSAHINFLGSLNTIKLALLSFLRSGKTGSVVVTASAAGYFDSSPVCEYAGTKHAVVGLLRSFRTITPVYNRTRINLVAPWMVDTNFAGDNVMKRWGELPKNSPQGCARAIIMSAINPELHGCGIFVGGDRYFELERGISETMSQWLGKEMADGFQEGWKRLSAPFAPGGDLAQLH